MVPHYANLALFHRQMPFTLPIYLLENVLQALMEYPERYCILQNRLDAILKSSLYEDLGLKTTHYEIIVSFVMTDFVQCVAINDFDLHANSHYLQTLNIAQISTIQPHFERDFHKLLHMYQFYKMSTQPTHLTL